MPSITNQKPQLPEIFLAAIITAIIKKVFEYKIGLFADLTLIADFSLFIGIYVPVFYLLVPTFKRVFSKKTH